MTCPRKRGGAGRNDQDEGPRGTTPRRYADPQEVMNLRYP